MVNEKGVSVLTSVLIVVVVVVIGGLVIANWSQMTGKITEDDAAAPASKSSSTKIIKTIPTKAPGCSAAKPNKRLIAGSVGDSYCCKDDKWGATLYFVYNCTDAGWVKTVTCTGMCAPNGSPGACAETGTICCVE